MPKHNYVLESENLYLNNKTQVPSDDTLSSGGYLNFHEGGYLSRRLNE